MHVIESKNFKALWREDNMKRESARAIIIENGKLLTIFRRKINELGERTEYYVIPGGGIEGNETPEITVKRELNEELGITIEIIKDLGIVEKEKTIEHYFYAKRINGTPKIGGEELDRMNEKNYYEVRYVELEKLQNLPFQGMELVNKALENDFE